jgi:hypothetical protein
MSPQGIFGNMGQFHIGTQQLKKSNQTEKKKDADATEKKGGDVAFKGEQGNGLGALEALALQNQRAQVGQKPAFDIAALEQKYGSLGEDTSAVLTGVFGDNKKGPAFASLYETLDQNHQNKAEAHLLGDAALKEFNLYDGVQLA